MILRACAAIAAVSLALACGRDAAGGEPAGGALLNGRPVAAGEPLTLRPGDRVATGADAASVRAATGAIVRVLPASSLAHMGTEQGVESFFVLTGTAEGDVDATTIVGAAAGWATASDAAGGRVRIDVEPDGPRGPDGAEVKDAATFRAVDGNVSVRYHAVAVRLPAGGAARLVPSADGPGSIACESPSGNPGTIELTRATGDVLHAAALPPGSSVTLSDRAGRTRFACRRADRGRPVRVEARSGGRAAGTVALGAGAAALLDGTGVDVEIEGVADGLLRDLVRLDREFATLGAK